jgi:SH3-like domain-containing protein
MKHRALGVAAMLIASALCFGRAQAADPTDAAPTPTSQPAPSASAPAPAAAPTAVAPASAAAPSAAAPAASAAVAAATPASAPEPASAPSVITFQDAERLQIADPYIELRTGPGRGFPIFFVAQRNDWVAVELRHTDWFRVRTDDGKVGWVSRQQLETTLMAGGLQKTFRDVMLDDFLNRKAQLGVAWGHLHGEPMLKTWFSYRMSETLSAEATFGQVQGVFSGTDLWHIDLLAEPWSDRRFSPFAGIGFGKFSNFPNQSLVGATTTRANLANAMVGVRYYLTERFVLRGDWSLYTVFVNDTKSNEYRAWTLGVSFFF